MLEIIESLNDIKTDKYVLFAFKNKKQARGFIESVNNPGKNAGFDLISLESTKIELSFAKEILLGGPYIKYKSALVKTGCKWAAPMLPGNYLAIAPRSGLSYKSPIRIANAVGTVEASYRNDIGVLFDITPFLTLFNTIKLLELKSPVIGVDKDDNGYYEFMIEDYPDIKIKSYWKLNKMIVEIPENYKIAQAIPIITQGEVSKIYGIIDENIYEDFDKLFPSSRGLAGYGSTGV